MEKGQKQLIIVQVVRRSQNLTGCVVQVAKATGKEPPKFEDHTPYLNHGMEDLLKLNELVSATRTEIIQPQLNKNIKVCTPLVLMETSIKMKKPSLKDYMYALAMACTMAVVGRQQSSCMIPRITPLLLRKGLPLPEW